MDWFSWLSKTHLDPPFIHEYAVAFSHNQLEEDDISYFNHEFLQSMGISIAKHRLEILKLARKSSGLHPMARLIATVKKTKRALAQHVHTWLHRNDSALVLVKKRSYSSRWKGALVKRSNRLVMSKQGSGTLLISNGYRPVVRAGSAKVNSFSGSLVYDHRHDESKEDDGKYRDNVYSDDEVNGGYGDGDGGSDGGDEYWAGCGGVDQEIKWDAMFQNLKPT
ncbi:putative sterile alpha motif domain-containing protein [Helianthus debilis subsp. tardiflorus]